MSDGIHTLAIGHWKITEQKLKKNESDDVIAN